MTSSPPCWWTKTKDLSFIPSSVRSPVVVHFSIVTVVSRDWLKTSYISTSWQWTCHESGIEPGPHRWESSAIDLFRYVKIQLGSEA